MILLDVDDETVVKRLCGRRMCKKCGRIYHVVFNPSSKVTIAIRAVAISIRGTTTGKQ